MASCEPSTSIRDIPGSLALFTSRLDRPHADGTESPRPIWMFLPLHYSPTTSLGTDNFLNRCTANVPVHFQ